MELVDQISSERPAVVPSNGKTVRRYIRDRQPDVARRNLLIDIRLESVGDVNEEARVDFLYVCIENTDAQEGV